jgi:hypothetical protein
MIISDSFILSKNDSPFNSQTLAKKEKMLYIRTIVKIPRKNRAFHQ